MSVNEKDSKAIVLKTKKIISSVLRAVTRNAMRLSWSCVDNFRTKKNCFRMYNKRHSQKMYECNIR